MWLGGFHQHAKAWRLPVTTSMDRERKVMSAALTIITEEENNSSFYTAPENAWFGTYHPKEKDLVLHFKRDTGRHAEVHRISQGYERETGAKWHTIDGVPHTLKNIEAMEPFTVLLSTYHEGPGYGRYIKGRDNIEPFEALLVAYGDEASAQKLRDNFPKLFAPVTALPALQPKARKRWHWPF